MAFKAKNIAQFGYGAASGGSSPVDPNTLIKTAGGNWDNTHLQPGDVANVQAGVPFGLGLEGTGVVKTKILLLKTPI